MQKGAKILKEFSRDQLGRCSLGNDSFDLSPYSFAISRILIKQTLVSSVTPAIQPLACTSSLQVNAFGKL